MDRKLTVLLVEDNQDECKSFVEYIEEAEDISLIGVTNNSDKALEYIKDYLPDAVILDIELHHGGGNGLLLLQQMRELAINPYPYILITTNNSSTITFDYARQLGADFIMSKHQDDYCAANVIDFLRMLKPVIHNKMNAAFKNMNTEPPEQKHKRIVQRITAELNRIGISPKATGYQYLIDGIQIIIKEPTQNLSSIIAQKYSKTESSIERAMQNAINKAWRTSDINDLLTYYTARISSEKGVPTITEFIYYYAHKIKQDY